MLDLKHCNWGKKYFTIDQQIVRHFVQYNESLSNPPSLPCNKNRDFRQLRNPYTPYCSSSVESLLLESKFIDLKYIMLPNVKLQIRICIRKFNIAPLKIYIKSVQTLN